MHEDHPSRAVTSRRRANLSVTGVGAGKGESLSSTWRQAVSLHRQLRARSERDARLRLLMEQLPAIVWSTDVRLRVISSLGGGLKALHLLPHPLAEVGLSEYFQ